MLLALMLFHAIGAEAQETAAVPQAILKPENFRHFDDFNRHDQELYSDVEFVKNADAWEFLRKQIPFFDCPDPAIEETYYFRWWTWRKHIEQTPQGFVITEFLPKVPWAGKYNTISCAAAFHVAEGRWLRDPRYVDDYLTFWLRGGGALRAYSFPIADATWETYLVTGDAAFATNLLPDLIANDREWDKTHLDPSGLYWQKDDRDGMEKSIGGSGYRPTINSSMYGDAVALGNLAELAGDTVQAQKFRAKARQIKAHVQAKLWDPAGMFFKTARRGSTGDLVTVREEQGYTPWYFDLPDAGYEMAWKQLTDPRGFAAPFGPTTAEQRDPGYRIAYAGHECQWNGPSWPFATSVTLTALANLLDDYRQDVLTPADYFNLLSTYTRSQRLKREDGTEVPWIDEDLDPQTGVWIAHRLLLERHQLPLLRGKDYNHSKYVDLIITGLVGLRPRADSTVEIKPLVPRGWDYFCLDGVRYHGCDLTILFDRTGRHYGRGSGLQILADGKVIAQRTTLGPLTGNLPLLSPTGSTGR
jgi:hypothetical protein